MERLELRSSFHEGLTSGVALVLVEVLDEAAGEVLGLLFPLGGVLVGVARIEDTGVYTLQLGGNGEVEVRDHLGRSLVDAVVQDGVDDTASVANRDALACAVPAGVDEVGLSSALFHLLDELFGILCGMQLEECLSEAG